MGFVIGVPLLSKMLEEQFYSDLPGGILEAMGRLFFPGVKLLVHPGYDPADGKFVTGHTLKVPEPIREIHEFLVRRGKIVDLSGTEKDLPACSSSEPAAVAEPVAAAEPAAHQEPAAHREPVAVAEPVEAAVWWLEIRSIW